MADPAYQYPEPDAADPEAATPSPTAGRRAPVRGELLNLDPKVRDRIASRVQKMIDSWSTSGTEHHANIRRWNDLLEGVIEETDFPWVGSSQLHIPLVATHLVTLHSVIARSVWTVDPIWTGSTLEEPVREAIPQIEEQLTYQARSETNISEAGRDVIYPAARDGLAWLMVPYVEEYETVPDVALIHSLREFQDKFPTPEDAGLSEEEYQQKVQEISKTAAAEAAVEIPVTVERLVYRGPKAYVVEEADMIRYPMTATELRGCTLYGRRFDMRREDCRKRVKEGALWKDAVDRLLAQKKNRPTENDWRANRDQIEGISQDNTNEYDHYDVFEGVIKLNMDEAGNETDEERKFFITYEMGSRRLLGVSEYIYRREIFIPFRLIKRVNRLIGRSVPGLLEDLNTEMDASIRQDVNSDTIAAVPLFKGKKSANKDFDPEAEENLIRPGLIFWLEDPEAFQIVSKNPPDRSGSTARRAELMRYAEMLVGPTQLLSGRESPIDPEAPGNKTIALIQQSNMRIEDYINELRYGYDELGQVMLSHNYQFGADEIRYLSSEEKTAAGVVKRDLLRYPIKLGIHGVTATLNPEVDFAKATVWYNLLAKEPMVGGDPVRHRTLLRDLMVAGRLQNRFELLPSRAEVEGQVQKQQEQAIRQKVLQELIRKGLLPSPNAQMPPPPAVPGAAPAAAPDLPPPVPVPGAPAGAAGLPPANNLPPPGL